MHAGDTTSREAFKGCQLPVTRGTLGIATVGDALHKLIPATIAAPASVKEVSSNLISLWSRALQQICLSACRAATWHGSVQVCCIAMRLLLLSSCVCE